MNYSITAFTVIYSYAGNVANLLAQRRIAAITSTFPSTSSSTSLVVRMPADGTSFSYVGNDANLNFTGIHHYGMNATTGVFIQINSPANLLSQRIIKAGMGNFLSIPIAVRLDILAKCETGRFRSKAVNNKLIPPRRLKMSNLLSNPLPVLERKSVISRVQLGYEGPSTIPESGYFPLGVINLPSVNCASIRLVSLNLIMQFAKSVGLYHTPYLSLSIPTEIGGILDYVEYFSKVSSVVDDGTNYIVSQRLEILEPIYISFNTIDFPDPFQGQVTLIGNEVNDAFTLNYFCAGDLYVCNY